MNQKKVLIELAENKLAENKANRSEYAQKMVELRGIWNNSKIGLKSQFGNFRNFVDFAKSGRDFFYAGKPQKVTKKNVLNIISHFESQKKDCIEEISVIPYNTFEYKETLQDLQNAEKKVNFYKAMFELAKF